MPAIWPPHEAFYIESLLFNTTSALASAMWVNSELHRLANEDSESIDPDFDSDEMLNSLQNVVVQAAAVSRYFWPVRKGYDERGEQLRSVLGVEESSPLRSRDLRNAIEHFDERLDNYLAQGIVGQIIPHYFGPLPEDDGVPRHVFRAYYFDVGQFELLGERFEIQPLVYELSRLHDQLTRCARNGYRLLPPSSPPEIR